jgi:hypothetical protein
VHTFFEECPIYENPIAFVNGTILRFRLSNYLMEVTDGYNELYFSLRSEGLTGVVPSAVVWNSPGVGLENFKNILEHDYLFKRRIKNRTKPDGNLSKEQRANFKLLKFRKL